MWFFVIGMALGGFWLLIGLVISRWISVSSGEIQARAIHELEMRRRYAPAQAPPDLEEVPAPWPVKRAAG